MISHISISDFAIIKHLSVDFHQGLNIITGETGAGKSIIIEAINLALGSRADNTFIRTGKDKAMVQIVFEEISKVATDFLIENGLTAEGAPEEQLILTREISASGKGVCRINGQIVSVSLLNKLCKRLADIHGQYDHQSLLNPDNHIQLLDLYGYKEIAPVKENLSRIYKDYLASKQALSALIRSEKENRRQKDFMEFELEEISRSKLEVGEDEALSKEISILKNSEKISEVLETSYETLYEGTPSTLTEIKHVIDLLSGLENFVPEILEQKEILSDCYYRIQDVSADIRKFKDRVFFDQDHLDTAISRINQLDLLKRKYGETIPAILQYKEELMEKLGVIENSDLLRETLLKDVQKLEMELAEICSLLSSMRKTKSAELTCHINNQLLELNFKDAVISIDFKEKAPEENGADLAEFMITTNKGESPKPLAKIGSGGEISRIMLAFKGILGNLDAIPTMIFDEIDSGISGITASIVGKKLLQLSNTHQIICITHLPQIAAYGNHNYKIEKITDEQTTNTTVIPLDEQSKILEIARLTGGISITDATLLNAKELVELSK